MEAIEAILSRRSIRKYTDQSIPEQVLTELIKTAMNAPSAGNQQPWQFIVLDDKKILKEITNFHPYAQALKNAPAAIVVCGDLNLEHFKGYWLQDCSAATMNILTTAHAKGLGAVWLGIYPETERITGLKKLLTLPEQIIPLAVVSLGYPAEKKEPAARYQESRIHYNGW